METIEDILREMRKDMPRVVDTKVILRNYADRIEAAVKALVADRDNWREQALAEGARANAATCKDSLQAGHAASLREALKYLRDASREFHHLILNSKHNEICDKYKYKEVAKISDAIANANFALSAPARNEEEK